MLNFGTTELLIILGIVVLIFGASRLPAIGHGLGQSIRGFRKALESDGVQEPDSALKSVQEEAEK